MAKTKYKLEQIKLSIKDLHYTKGDKQLIGKGGGAKRKLS